ncbi:MAG: hypothetical protein PHE29_08725 [Tissierellia bacterium]|nr:hypothetical protein [Tissierellia bacterium]
MNSKRQIDSSIPMYKCTRCGRTWSDPKGHFFMSKTSPLFVGNELYSNICCDCANELFNEMKLNYKDSKVALMIVCIYLDIYFSEELYNSIKDNANFSLGNYLKLLNGNQYKAKNSITFIVNLIQEQHLLKDESELREEKEVKWKQSDIKNKNYVIQTIGYDCFEDESYTDFQRRFLFNTLADSLTDDVIEDPHKLQCVISLVKTRLQLDNVDSLINGELRKKIPDDNKIKQWSGIKDVLSRTINSTANENGISAKTSGKSGKGANTLTNIMKEMSENNFDEIKVNVVDVKMQPIYQDIAKASTKAIFEELNETSDNYAGMVEEQSKMIGDYQDKITKLQEEIRKVMCENKELKTKIEGEKE